MHFTICFYNPEKSLGLNSGAGVAPESSMASFFPSTADVPSGPGSSRARSPRLTSAATHRPRLSLQLPPCGRWGPTLVLACDSWRLLWLPGALIALCPVPQAVPLPSLRQDSPALPSPGLFLPESGDTVSAPDARWAAVPSGSSRQSGWRGGRGAANVSTLTRLRLANVTLRVLKCHLACLARGVAARAAS